MLGIALGVAALIIVLSVMNGFQKEVRDRILGVVSHIEILGARRRRCADWQRIVAEARAEPAGGRRRALRAAQALLARGDDMRGALVRGIVPDAGGQVADIGQHMQARHARRPAARASSASCSAPSSRARSACAWATRSR